MACHICEVIERDLEDVARALESRKAAKTRAPADGESDLDLEIRALASAKAQIEARYSKHREAGLH